MAEIHYESPDQRFCVCLPADVMRRIQQVCRQAGMREVGGILVGYYANENHWAIVTQASGPPHDSHAGPMSFRRGIFGLQAWLDKLWGRGRYYLGEWHYHPFASPEPSDQDIAQMAAISKSSQFSCPEPILLIIGGDPSISPQLRAMVFPNSGMPVLLEAREVRLH